MTQSEVIAELEINHGASLDIAKQMIYASKAAGADTVKFQAFNAKEFTSPGSKYREIFDSLQLNNEEFKILKEYAESQELNFLLTIADLTSVKLIEDLKLKRVKVGSTNITNHILLEKISRTNVDIILSTGAATLDEIKQGIEIINEHKNDSRIITLMQCTVSYPCQHSDLNLRGMQTLREEFSNVEIGFSDHSSGHEAGMIAAALGAKVIEKHMTLSKLMQGPDHNFSMNPEELKNYVSRIRETYIMLGNGIKEPQTCEKKVRITGRRYLAYSKGYTKGTLLTESDFLIQRQAEDNIEKDNTLSPTKKDVEYIYTRRLTKDVKSFQTINRSDFK